jgi:hypothetical protein
MNVRIVVVVVVGLVLAWQPVARATVYTWKGDGGLLMMSNDPADVPEDQRDSARRFTSKPAPPSQPVVDADVGPDDAYSRGFDAGLQAADRQVALAADLGRTIAASVPQVPPAPVIIEQAAPVPQPDVASYAPPYYDGYPPYAAYGFPYAVVSFPSHRRFDGRGRRFGSSGPHGPLSHGWPGGWSPGASGDWTGRMR